jgi:hypothetical protein
VDSSFGVPTFSVVGRAKTEGEVSDYCTGAIENPRGFKVSWLPHGVPGSALVSGEQGYLGLGEIKVANRRA